MTIGKRRPQSITCHECTLDSRFRERRVPLACVYRVESRGVMLGDNIGRINNASDQRRSKRYLPKISRGKSARRPPFFLSFFLQGLTLSACPSVPLLCCPCSRIYISVYCCHAQSCRLFSQASNMQDRGLKAEVISWLFTSVAICMVTLRLISRVYLKKLADWDDVFLVLALVS